MATNPSDEPDPSNEPGEPTHPPAHGRKNGRARGCLRFVLGLVLGLAVVLTVIVLRTRGTGVPRLKPDDYEQASRRWDDNGPANYNLDVAVTGNRPSQIHVEVRDREVTHCVRDGVEPSQRRTWYYWTVPGMLDTIGQELDKIGDPATGFGAAAGSSVVLRAEFDEKLGYPRRYLRSVAGQNLDMGWTITHFETTE